MGSTEEAKEKEAAGTVGVATVSAADFREEKSTRVLERSVGKEKVREEEEDGHKKEEVQEADKWGQQEVEPGH